jgi:hypothetical protein
MGSTKWGESEELGREAPPERRPARSVEQFEDLEVLKKARELTQRIYQATRAGEFSRDYALRDQIRRSSTSIMANVAEGFERGGDREFRQFWQWQRVLPARSGRTSMSPWMRVI